jgi:hypothetical protein
MDNTISEYGPLVKVRLRNPWPRPFLLGDGEEAFPGTVEVDALVSTGAAMTSVHPDLIRFPLGLAPLREVRRRTAPGGGAEGITTYTVHLEVEGARLAGLEVTDGSDGRDFARARWRLGGKAGEALPPPHVILGRDVLCHGRLVYEGSRGAFDLVFG